MGKNKLRATNKLKSGNPIYKKAGVSHNNKAKSKTKPVKTNLKKIHLGNKKATEALDKKVDAFRQAVSDSLKKPAERPAKAPVNKQQDVNMDEAAEELSKL